MDSPRLKRNPLMPILVACLVISYFDVRFYFIEHHFFALGLSIVASIVLFIILFFMRSRLAWLAAVIVVLVIAVTLFLTYQLGYMGFPLTWFLGTVDLFLFALFLGYLWKKREPYLRYVAANEI